jgi:hypothetical protein
MSDRAPRRRRRQLLCVTVADLMTLIAPAAVRAQQPRAYVGAAAMLSIQGSHRLGADPSLPTTGAGGAAAGVTVEAGAFLAPAVAIGAEVSVPRRFTALQETDYLRVFQQQSRHRDLAISGVVRVRILSSRRASLWIAGGAGLVEESTLQRRRDQASLLPTYPPVFGPYSDEYSFTRWTPSALAGLDVQIALASHLAIIPQLRVHFVPRTDDPSNPGWALGLSRFVVRPAVGLRATF